MRSALEPWDLKQWCSAKVHLYTESEIDMGHMETIDGQKVWICDPSLPPIGSFSDDPVMVWCRRLGTRILGYQDSIPMENLWPLVERLEEQQRQILELRYGLDESPLSITEIMARLCLTRGQVCKSEKAAIEELRMMLASSERENFEKEKRRSEMDFAADVAKLGSQVAVRKEQCKGNEEATKHALILPFFQLLGYDTSDPSVLVPEYKAGFASNKEKVDYAIFLNGKPALFVEAKAVGVKLENYDAQLAKYFNGEPDVKLALITQGTRYKFFTDLQKPNLLDPEPFFEIDIEAITPEEIDTLKFFRADSFNSAELVSLAENLVFLRRFKEKIRSLFHEPSDDFIRFMGSDFFSGKVPSKVLDRLRPLVSQAMSTVRVEMASQGLSQEIAKAGVAAEVETVEANELPTPAPEPKEPKIVTTEEELAGFALITKMLSSDGLDVSKVAYKDTQSYFGIHHENPSKWFIRLYFNGKQKYAAINLPIEKAKALLGGDTSVEEYTGSVDSCRVNVSGVEGLNQFRSLILAAYRSVAQGVVV